MSESNLRRFGSNFLGIYVLLSLALLLFGVGIFELFDLKAVLTLVVTAWYTARSSQSVAFSTGKFIGRLFDGNTESMGRRSSQSYQTVDQETPHEIAQRALRRAGYDPETSAVDLMDIGLLVYRGGEHPSNVARDEQIRSDATHVRPFLKFDYPLAERGEDQICFELIDAQGRVRYKDQDWYDLRPGENFLTTSTWLPLREQMPDGRWTLRVTVGETPLALHTFRWKKVRIAEVRARLQSDGEIDDDLQDAIQKPSNRPLSLDELLADQSDQSVPPLEAKRRYQEKEH